MRADANRALARGLGERVGPGQGSPRGTGGPSRPAGAALLRVGGVEDVGDLEVLDQKNGDDMAPPRLAGQDSPGRSGSRALQAWFAQV